MIATERELTLQSAAAATGNGTPLNVAGFHTVTAQVTGTFTATITWEGTLDNTNWIALRALNTSTGAVATTASAAGIYQIPVSGLQHFRARVSAYTDGAVTVLARAIVPSIPLPYPLAVSLYGTTTLPGDTPILANATRGMVVAMHGTGQAVGDAVSETLCNLGNKNDVFMRVPTFRLGYNGATWDRIRNNMQLTVLAAGARTGNTDSADMLNYNHRGVMLWLNITAVPGVDTITLCVQGKDPASGSYPVIFEAAAVSATGIKDYVVYPGANDVSSDLAGKNDIPLPRIWRVHITHSGAGEFTYSVAACYIL